MGKIIIETKKGNFQAGSYTGVIIWDIFHDKVNLERILNVFFEEYKNEITVEDILSVRIETK